MTANGALAYARLRGGSRLPPPLFDTMLDPETLADYNAWRQARNKAIFCHAPFTNLNFGQNGDATACCYNRSHVLGTYPEDSIDEMWHGERAQRLRALLRENALPGGCQLCLDQFRSRNFGGLRARFYDKHAEETWEETDGRLSSWPRVMEFEISNVCNLECAMCSGDFSSAIRKHREGLPQPRRPFDRRFVEQLEPYIPHLVEAKFLGGEPFLNHLYYEIWDRIARLHPAVEVVVVTNGTILTDKVKRALEPLNAHIDMSIDALDPESYERIRVNAKFDSVMANFAYFREYVERKRTTMTVSVCPMQQNWMELPRFLEFCREWNVGLFFNTVWYPEEESLRLLPAARLREILEYLRDVPLSGGSGVARTNERNYLDLIRQIEAFRDRTVAPEAHRFTGVSLAGSAWSLRTGAGNEASLAVASTGPELAQIAIGDAPTPSAWDIQLNRGPLTVEARRHYRIAFRARARRPRYMAFGITEWESPREKLGKHRFVRLTPEWHSFEMVFGPIPRGGAARIHFDVGGSSAGVEVADLELRTLAGGSPQ